MAKKDRLFPIWWRFALLAWILLTVFMLSGCDKLFKSPTGPSNSDKNIREGLDSSPNLERPEVYYSPPGLIRYYNFTKHEHEVIPIPAGSFVVKVTAIKPARGSLLTNGQLVGIGFTQIIMPDTPNPDEPDKKFHPEYHLVDSSGNDLPTRFLAGGAESLFPGEERSVFWSQWFAPSGISCGQPFDIRVFWYWDSHWSNLPVSDENGQPLKVIVPLGWKWAC